jgi:hypothetical protein
VVKKSLASMLKFFAKKPNIVLSKAPASRRVIFSDLNDFFAPAVTLQMAHIFYAAKQLGLPTFSNPEVAMITNKTRFQKLAAIRDEQQTVVNNKEIISYVLYAYSITKNNVVPFPAQKLTGPLVSACNGYNSNMASTCGYERSNILIDTFVVDLLEQIEAKKVRYTCLFSVEPEKLAAGIVGNP